MLKQAGHNRVKAFLVLSAELLQYLFESLYLLSSSVNMATGYYPCCNFRFGKKLQNSKHFISFPANPAELYCPRSEIAVDPNYWTSSQIRWAPACHRLRQNENTVVIKLKTRSNIVKVYNCMQSIHIHKRMYDISNKSFIHSQSQKWRPGMFSFGNSSNKVRKVIIAIFREKWKCWSSRPRTALLMLRAVFQRYQ